MLDGVVGVGAVFEGEVDGRRAGRVRRRVVGRVRRLLLLRRQRLVVVGGIGDPRLGGAAHDRFGCFGRYADAQVLDCERVGVVGVGHVVAELGGALALDAARVAAAQHELRLPERVGGVGVGHGVVADAEEEVGDERAAHAVVPRCRLGREGVAPDLADVRRVVCVVHVEGGELALHLREWGGGQTERPGARGGRGEGASSQLAGAAQRGVGREEGVEERALVVLCGVADEGVPVGLAETLAHAKVVPNARARLCE